MCLRPLVRGSQWSTTGQRALRGALGAAGLAGAAAAGAGAGSSKAGVQLATNPRNRYGKASSLQSKGWVTGNSTGKQLISVVLG